MGTRSMERGSTDNNKFFFEKCRVVKSNDDLMVEEDDLEFEALVKPRYISRRVRLFRRRYPKI